MNKLLQDCYMGLNQTMGVFKLQAATETLNDIREFKNKADLIHAELITLIETLSDSGTFSERSSVYQSTNVSKNSSNSFSMLPAKPKIFYGREQELDSVLKLLNQVSPRIAILGGGGMGKTSLAKAVLLHPDTSSKFEHRFFVSAEAATSSIELAALVGLHIGLNPGQDLTKFVVRYFTMKQSCLLILDNLETVWEPIQSRNGIEEFLSLLSEVEHLALMITMRGAERPAKVQWTHPCLLPLQPLSDDAARQTFMDITDNSNTYEEVTQLLEFTDNMPLAVDLMAHLVDYEGFSNVLERWEAEKTSLLSVGFDRQSSLDASIRLSLSSSRLTSGSKELLSLLAILPNGLSEAELVESHLGIPNILSCKAALQATSLIYRDGNKRFLLLMPVREYIQQFMPVSECHIQTIRKTFYVLLRIFRKYQGEQLQPVLNQITLNLANLHEVLKRGLDQTAETFMDTIYCALSLNRFCQFTGRGYAPLMDYIQHFVSGPHNHKLKTMCTLGLLRTPKYHTLVSEETIVQVISQLEHTNDPLLEEFYQGAGLYFQYKKADLQQAMQFHQKALALSEQCADSKGQCSNLIRISALELCAGDYAAAKTHLSTVQRLSKLSGDLHTEAMAIQFEASCSIVRGHYRESTAQLNKARELVKMSGFSGGELHHNIMRTLGEIHYLKSEYAQARHIHSQEVETTSPTHNGFSYAYALLNVAQIDLIIDGPREDMYHRVNTARITAKLTSRDEISIECDRVQAMIEVREKKFDVAYSRFCECLKLTWVTFNECACPVLEQLADIKTWPLSAPQHKWPPIYLVYACKSKDKLALHKALLFLGDVFLVNEDETTATSLYQVALAGFTNMDVHHYRALCMLRLGDMANKQGSTSEAIALWKAARPLFVLSSQVQDVADIDCRIEALENTHQKL
ncbi:hypothetical protein K438DRAFT_355284 [Mycena galopus ATCC 62051]|nr:hypothetical protein K438DRAFT_355284 [Mycena galopus ATCC 62051]